MSTAFDFQAQQERTRRDSALLVLLFLLLTAVVAIAVGGAAGWLIGAAAESDFDGAVAATAGVIAGAIVLAVALARILAWGGDGARVAEALGAEEVDPDVRNPYKRRYLNVVEEMAIAGGLPRPRVFVLRREQGINAFAAGADPERGAIAVTHGALAKLNRQELAGVVAHELSHLANRDSRLNLRLMGMVYGLVVLYVLGRGLLRSSIFIPRRRDARSMAPALALGLALVLVGALGVLAGRILQSAVSRRREALADATAVQFTRDPAGLAAALKKIGASSAGSHVDNAHAEEARHMFFAAATGSFAGLFDTHPPLVERIRALEPQFDPATDPVWRRDDKALLRESRRELKAGPWDRP